MFRTLDAQGGVLLLDEAERLRDSTPEARDLRSILLSGYKQGSPARRLEKVGDSYSSVAFDVFGPKALAAVGGLSEALASRCIRIVMQRVQPDSERPRRRLECPPHAWADLRDRLHVLALENGPDWVALAGRAELCPERFGWREFELWQPLFALAAWFAERGVENLVTVIEKFAVHTVEVSRARTIIEEDEVLLRVLARHVADGTAAALRATALLAEAREHDDALFVKWSPRRVSATLEKYGIRTTKGRGNTGRVYSRVTLTHLRKIEAAYGFDLDLEAGDVPTCTERADSRT